MLVAKLAGSRRRSENSRWKTIAANSLRYVSLYIKSVKSQEKFRNQSQRGKAKMDLHRGGMVAIPGKQGGLWM